MHCNFDSDCPGTLACGYSGTCGCLTDYGWKGEDCSQFGPYVFFSLVFSALTAIVALGVVAVCFYDVYVLVTCSGARTMLVNYIILLSATFLSGLAMLAHTTTHMIAIMSPHDVTLSSYGGDTKKYARLETPLYFNSCTAIKHIFGCIAAVHMTLLWGQLALSANAFSSGRLLTQIKLAAVCIDFLVSALYVVMVVTGQFAYASFALLIVCLLIVILFILAGTKIIKLLEESIETTGGWTQTTEETCRGIYAWNTSENRALYKVILAINRSRSLIAVSVLLLAILVVALSVLLMLNDRDGSFELMPYGKLGYYYPIAAIRDFLETFILVAFLDFVHPNIMRRSLASKTSVTTTGVSEPL
mmetsp:Transcript_11255/g.20910  ORF Transcript_11255/g.20910 Transcript_11255/m.20910 type:complete len:359 (-) Transcript_11255:1663-2739(-)